MNNVHFSSDRMDWETPDEIFDALDAVHHFTLDVCATDENAKCPRYLTPEMDGLNQDWHGRCWMNPPYGREISKWMQKAYTEVWKRHAASVVCLVPARTDTAWWHDYAMKADEIRLVKGRLKFGGRDAAPFPSAVVIFRPESIGPPRFSAMERP